MPIRNTYVDEIIDIEDGLTEGVSQTGTAKLIRTEDSRSRTLVNRNYRFMIDAFTDKVSLERQREHEVSANGIFRGGSLTSEISTDIIFTSGDGFKVEESKNKNDYNALGMTEPLNQDFIINIEAMDNTQHPLKTQRESFKNQLKFALKPKLSGNVDLRLNRLNLRVIDKAVKSIKFFANLATSDQVKKVKDAFTRLGLK